MKLFYGAIFILINFIKLTNLFLLYPRNSIIQLSMAVVSLVESPDLNMRKVQVNSGWQTNFNLPATVQTFTNPVNFPGWFNSKRSNDQAGEHERRKRMVAYEKYKNGSRIVNDVAAGALYNSLREMLPFYGYHEECLEKSICEMAKHPIHIHEHDIISELLHIALTPSVHRAFDDNELEDEKYYGQIEEFGKIGGNCEELFHNCKESLLAHITEILEVEEK